MERKKLLISFVFPIRNEYPQATWTVYSLIEDVPEGEDFEVILCANASDEVNKKWLDWFSRGRLAKHGKLHVIMREEPGLWESLELGFDAAKGDVLCWGCGHIAVHRGTIGSMLSLVRKGGIVHSPLLWMGDWAPKNRWKCYQYHDPIYRGWSFFRVSDLPYTVSSSGGGLSMVGRKEWFDLGTGLHPKFTLTGGGETFMDLKWWLLGNKVSVHPDALYYHWAYHRNWHWDKYEKADVGWSNHNLRNTAIALYCLGGMKWVDKTLGAKFAKKYPLWMGYYNELPETCAEERKYILKHQKYDGLEGLFAAEPWDYPKKALHKCVKSY